MKRIDMTVANCQECPFNQDIMEVWDPYTNATCVKVQDGREFGIDGPDYLDGPKDGFPDWCPLPDERESEQ